MSKLLTSKGSSMAGEKDLNALLSSMSPRLLDDEYVFCSFEAARYGELQELEPIVSCAEAEGLTLIVPKRRADERGLEYESVFKGITLTVHSSLDAVGFTAAISAKLTEQGISANIVAGYFHDHVFVQRDLADHAMAALGG